MKKKRGVIAASHPQTSEAGAEMLRKGGNVVDAAVAAAFASFVTEPTLTSMGGSGYLVYHQVEHDKTEYYDFFSTMPGKKLHFSRDDLDFYDIIADFGPARQVFHVGMGATAVWGNVAGLCHVHQDYGILPFEEVLEPAIGYAQHGVVVNAMIANTFRILEPILNLTPDIQQFFYQNGNLLKEGDIFKNSPLADTMRHLCKTGVEQFYHGEIARELLDFCANNGGIISIDDLQDYPVVIKPPLSISFLGDHIYLNPPPSMGGTMIAFALSIWERSGLGKLKQMDDVFSRSLVACMATTNQAREDGTFSLKNLLNGTCLQDQMLNKYSLLLKEVLQSSQVSVGLGDVKDKSPSTTHISIIDQTGNAVSITTSNGEGNGYVLPDRGIVLNNFLGEEDINPDGFHCLLPGEHLNSMMTPTVEVRDKKANLSLGSGGSNRIRTAILQTILNVRCLGYDINNAVNSSRIHWERGKLYQETYNMLPEIHQSLLSFCPDSIAFDHPNMYFGGVNAAMFEDNKLFGAGDKRRGGSVVIVD